ncbi:MAG TPA: tol-pal system-associated acyl-CoA thioesterase [Stellaceae bacterium]|nr:tol-pal system-associated acyl-CoA thioesterase [Stellaceae bacterium]
MIPARPEGGRVEGRAFLFPIRVYYEDTDAGAIVYHAAYLRFAERARTEFLRHIGWPHQRMHRETGSFWAVRRLSVDYRRPARLDDALIVTSTVEACGGASVDVLQVIAREDEEAARVKVQLAVLSEGGRPARIPAALRQALLPYLDPDESPNEPCKSMP